MLILATIKKYVNAKSLVANPKTNATTSFPGMVSKYGKPAEASMHIHHKDSEHIFIPLCFYL